MVAVAGTTDAGAIDPLSDVADVAEEIGAHFHVDAAWGGPLLFSPTLRHRLKGIERASSVTIDGHKQLYAPVGTGVLLFREPSLAHVIRQEAPYILRLNSRDLGKHHIEGSRPATALYLHASLHILGCSGFTALVEEGIRQARYAAASIARREEFELLLPPETNIVLYRFVPSVARRRNRRFTDKQQHLINHANTAIHRLQRNQGQSLVSRTVFSATPRDRVTPLVALRAVFTNPLTTNEDIELTLDEQSELGLHLE
jgi:glutamate decarboxylase